MTRVRNIIFLNTYKQKLHYILDYYVTLTHFIIADLKHRRRNATTLQTGSEIFPKLIWENIEEALNSLPDLGSQNLQQLHAQAVEIGIIDF